MLRRAIKRRKLNSHRPPSSGRGQRPQEGARRAELDLSDTTSALKRHKTTSSRAHRIAPSRSATSKAKPDGSRGSCGVHARSGSVQQTELFHTNNSALPLGRRPPSAEILPVGLFARLTISDLPQKDLSPSAGRLADHAQGRSKDKEAHHRHSRGSRASTWQSVDRGVPPSRRSRARRGPSRTT